MATYVVEQQNSRSLSYDGGKTTASRTFKVYSDSGGIDAPADIRALFGTATTPDAMPAVGATFPDDAAVYAKSYSIDRDPNTDLWTVVWNYSNTQIDEADKQPGEVGFVEWTLDIQASFADTWRENPNYPSNGNAGSSQADQSVQGGTPIDIEGVPVSRLKYSSELVVNETIENYGGVPSIIAAARAARGKRNNGAWQGFATGTVVYTGAKISRQGINLYQVSHRFVEDSEYHLIQYPDRDSTGKIPVEPMNGRNRAKTILWRQPFPSLYNFDSISSNW